MPLSGTKKITKNEYVLQKILHILSCCNLCRSINLGTALYFLIVPGLFSVINDSYTIGNVFSIEIQYTCSLTPYKGWVESRGPSIAPYINGTSLCSAVQHELKPTQHCRALSSARASSQTWHVTMGNYDISRSTMPVYVGKSGFADAAGRLLIFFCFMYQFWVIYGLDELRLGWCAL